MMMIMRGENIESQYYGKAVTFDRFGLYSSSFSMGFCSLPSRPSHVGQLGEDRPVEIGNGLMIIITKSLSKMLKKPMKITFYLFKI